jgi:hypothetical protein
VRVRRRCNGLSVVCGVGKLDRAVQERQHHPKKEREPTSLTAEPVQKHYTQFYTQCKYMSIKSDLRIKDEGIGKRAPALWFVSELCVGEQCGIQRRP